MQTFYCQRYWEEFKRLHCGCFASNFTKLFTFIFYKKSEWLVLLRKSRYNLEKKRIVFNVLHFGFIYTSEWRVKVKLFLTFKENQSHTRECRVHTHCVKNVQIRNFFWSVFSRIQSEYGKIRTRKNSVFGHFSRRDSLKLRGAKAFTGSFNLWKRFSESFCGIWVALFKIGCSNEYPFSE